MKMKKLILNAKAMLIFSLLQSRGCDAKSPFLDFGI